MELSTRISNPFLLQKMIRIYIYMATGVCSLNLVSKQSVWKSLTSSACSTVQDFEQIINNKLYSLGLPSNKTNINKIGAIILRECIIDKLNLLSRAGGNRELLRQRIAYYNSEDFIDRFTASMPVKTGNTRTKYASYFDLLFNIVSKSDDGDGDDGDGDGWRDRFNKYSDQDQCMRAKRIDRSRFKTVPQVQNNPPPTICYLCNREILPKGTNDQKTMECEHILPVSSALSHWWLIKSNADQPLNDAELSELAYEYGWSHRCCNQIKTNSEFIIYDSRLDEYVFNRDLVKTMLEDIKTSTKYDCSVANNREDFDVDTQLINIQRTVQPLLDKINQNLNATESHDMYELICKFKIISSMSEESFRGVIASTSDSDNTAKLNAERAEKSRKTRLANETMRQQEKAEEDEEKRKKREASKQRRLNSLRTRDALKEGTKRRVENTIKIQKKNRFNRTKRNRTNEGDIKEQLSEIAEETSGNTMNISPYSIAGGSSIIQPNETSGDDNLDELLNVIGSGVDENMRRDVEEKFNDVIKSYKYTVFRENEYGEIVKHKHWIYLDEDIEEQMRLAKGAEALHAPYMLNLGMGVNKKRFQGKKNKKFRKTKKKIDKRKKKRSGQNKRNEQNKRKKTKQQRIKN